MPFSRKVLVFKAVVNGALLSGLEVRPLITSPSDCQSLEKARGLLLRRHFGKHGFRCSCWWKYQSFGFCCISSCAGYLTHGCLWATCSSFALVSISSSSWSSWSSSTGTSHPFCFSFSACFVPGLATRDSFLLWFCWCLACWCVEVGFSYDHVPFSSPEIFDDDGGVPEVLAAPLSCAQCGAGPHSWMTKLWGHIMFGSIICVIPFTAQIVRLAFVTLQAKVQHKGMPTRDLVEGLCGIMVMLVQLQDNVWLPQLQRPRLKLGPHIDLWFSHSSAPSSTHKMPGMDFLQAATSPTMRPQKHSRGEGSNKSLEQQVQELTQHMQKLSQVVVAHDSSLRDWSTHTWLLAAESELSQMLMYNKATTSWRACQADHRCCLSRMDFRWCVSKGCMPTFSILHDKMEGLADMQMSVQLALAKPIKDGRILLKIRPQMAYQSEWSEAFAVLDGLGRAVSARLLLLRRPWLVTWDVASSFDFFVLTLQSKAVPFWGIRPSGSSPPVFSFRGSQAPSGCMPTFAEPMSRQPFYFRRARPIQFWSWNTTAVFFCLSSLDESTAQVVASKQVPEPAFSLSNPSRLLRSALSLWGNANCEQDASLGWHS